VGSATLSPRLSVSAAPIYSFEWWTNSSPPESSRWDRSISRCTDRS
jgi:hypothetical protein